jgi:branched-chain amino acid transport system substrate-binding protein
MGKTNRSQRRSSASGLWAAVVAASATSCSFIVDTLDCQSNADCLAQSDYTICRRSAGATSGLCVPLLTQECSVVQGDWQNDDAFLFGSVLPTTGSGYSTGKACENAIGLAVDDFQSAANGLPAVPGQDSKRRRPLAFVGCSDDSSAAQGVTAARHLVDVLGVPAILGAQWSGITTAIANEVTVSGRVLLISPSATAISITGLADEGLVWRTSPSDIFQGDALVRYVQHLEQTVRADRALTPGQKVKVALVYQGSTYGIGLSNKVLERLQLNGSPATGGANQQAFMQYNYGNTDTTEPLTTSTAVTKLLDFKPDIIVNLCTDEGITQVLGPTEARWSTVNGTTPRPLWVMGDGAVSSELYKTVGTNDALRQRVTGTVPGSQGPLFGTFKGTLGAVSDPGTDPAALGPAGAYDSVYLLAYAATSLRAQPITGPNLALALKKLGPDEGKTLVSVGPNDINPTLTTMLSGGAVDFRGASGELDFDWNTGEAKSDIQIWCMPRGDDDKAGGAVHSGLFLEAAKYTGLDPPATLSGTFDSVLCDR